MMWAMQVSKFMAARRLVNRLQATKSGFGSDSPFKYPKPLLARPSLFGSCTQGLLHGKGKGRVALTWSAPKSVSLMAMVGGDERIVEAHDKAVSATLGWIEANAIETRMRDPATGAKVRAEKQKMVAATFRHDTSRNLDPQLHTHAVVANMVQGCRPESAAQAMTLVRSAG